MNEPTYEELKHRVEELEKLVNFKVYPHDIYSETRDLLYFRINRDWYFDFFDRKLLDLSGYHAQDFTDKHICWLDIVCEEDRAKLENALNHAMQSDKYFSVEFRITRKQGDIKWINMRGPVFCDEKGKACFVQGVMNDITSRKNTEMALESEHEIFVWVANNLEDGIYIVSADYRITFMNKALIELVGDHVGEVCYEALFQRDTVCPWTVRDVIRQERCGFQEYQLNSLGKTFQVRSFPIKNRDGSIGKLGQLKDITQTRKLKNEVREFETRQRAIEEAANLADVGIFIIQDYDGMEARFRYVNEAMCRMTDYSSTELQNKSIADVVHPHHVQDAMERYRHRQHGEILNHAYELKLLRKDGAALTVFFSVALSSYDGRTATIVFVQDLTERKRVQQSLWLSQRLASIGKLAAEIAHEINNPLTSVLTFTKLLNRIIFQEPFPQSRLGELRKFVSLLDSEATRCTDIARKLLDFSRQGEIEVKENDIHEILEKTLDILRHRAQMNEITIRTAYAHGIPYLFCDFKRLQQAFVNLFWNAIEAMPEGGILSVTTSFDRGQNLISIDISDSGMGISEEHLESIFEPFFTTKAEGKGVGLGLSVAYGIIRQHQGHIQVSSEPGKGTRFLIQLRADIDSLDEENSND